jgi:outer membrane biosynthesis protein TonB
VPPDVPVPPEVVEPEPPDVEEPEPELDDEPPPEAVSDEVEVAAALSPPDDVSPPVEAAFRALDPRSFFAQPDPLKWMVGGAKAFRISVLPQIGQLAGLGSWTPWITSNR